jgi:hypothetical protein
MESKRGNVTLLMTDIGSIAVTEKEIKDWIDVDSENLEGTFLDQNTIEQQARGRVSNITDRNFDILKGLFCSNFPEINSEEFNSEEFTKELYRDELIENKGSLSNTLFAMFEKMVPKENFELIYQKLVRDGIIKDEEKEDSEENQESHQEKVKKWAKGIIGKKIWPSWANAVTSEFIRDKQDKFAGREIYVVLAAKVGASQKCLEEAMRMFNIGSDKVVYLQGNGREELLEENEEGVPYVINSGKYSNHTKKAYDLAKKHLEKKEGESITQEELLALFASETRNEVFYNEFVGYLDQQILERKEAVGKVADTDTLNICKRTDVRKFLKEVIPQTWREWFVSYLPKPISCCFEREK